MSQNSAPGQSDVVGLIQARMSSTRLFGKVLRSYAGSSVLERVVTLTRSFVQQVVVCTSSDASDDAIASYCAAESITCVRGSLDDVFSRFRQALNSPLVQRTPWFFRITADCPLLSIDLARRLLDAATDQLDYLAYDDSCLPRGLSSELVRRVAFESIDAGSLDSAEREHVTVALRERPEFRSHCLPVPEALAHPELRLTLDYPEDERLLQALWSVNPALSAEAAVSYLLSHPELAAINQGCQQRAVRAPEALDAARVRGVA